MIAERSKPDSIQIRPAVAAETPRLETLIAASARELSRGFYTPEEIEAAVTHVFGVDSDLIADGSYFVAEQDGELAGCGGWSRRRTLFGGDGYAGRASGFLDPASEAARIRAFFIAPGRARSGIGSALLAACEGAAALHGFTAATLMATLPGVPFYARHGYRGGEPETFMLGDTPVRFVPMSKQLLPTSHTPQSIDDLGEG